MNERTLKTLWHLTIAALAAIESKTCDRRTVAGKLRFLLLAGVTGWHIGGATMDWWDAEKMEK